MSIQPNVIGPARLASVGDLTTITVARKFNVTNLDVDQDEATMTKRVKQHKKWNRRFKIFFCCLGYKRNKDSIADVASIFAEFYSDLNVPSSDVAAGFVLLSKYQAAQRQWIIQNQQMGIEQYLSTVPVKPQTNFLDISTAQDSHLINDLIYYMNYSLAIFGWPLQIVDDPCMLCCICPYLRLSQCRGGNRRIKIVPAGPEKTDDQQQSPDAKISDNQDNRKVGQLDKDSQFNGPIVLEDNFCGCNVASVERRLASHHFEIVYATYKVDINRVPFLVAADHSKQTIVVALRGSMSLSDMITDLNGVIDRLPIENCPDDWHCHRGATRAALNVKATLIRERVLEAAFNCRPDLGSQNYNLILCGHSLGAGVAAILGIILRPMYPDLKAYLYSPPGGMLSLPAVEYTKQFATGIILGNDCVPSLGMAQLERLKYQILLSLKSSKRPTRRVLAKAICPTFCFGGNKVEYDPSQSLNLLHATEGRSFDYNGNIIPFQAQPEVLYVPGRLIHIVKNYSLKSKTPRLFNDPIYQAIWNDNTMYDRILIGEGMLFDHLPNNLMHAMKMLFLKTLPARKESKQSIVVSATNTTTIDVSNNVAPNGDNPKQQQCHDSIPNGVGAKQATQMLYIEDDNNNNNYINDNGADIYAGGDHNQKIKFDENNNNNDNNDSCSVITNGRNQSGNHHNAHRHSGLLYPNLAKTSNARLSTRSDTIIANHPSNRSRAFTSSNHAANIHQQQQIIRADNDKWFDNNGNDDSVTNKNH